MPYDWPEETDFALWELDVLDRECPACGRMMHVCDHRSRRFHTLQGPVEVLCRLDRFPHRDCPRHPKTKNPQLQGTPPPPQWALRLGGFFLVGLRPDDARL